MDRDRVSITPEEACAFLNPIGEREGPPAIHDLLACHTYEVSRNTQLHFIDYLVVSRFNLRLVLPRGWNPPPYWSSVDHRSVSVCLLVPPIPHSQDQRCVIEEEEREETFLLLSSCFSIFCFLCPVAPCLLFVIARIGDDGSKWIEIGISLVFEKIAEEVGK